VVFYVNYCGNRGIGLRLRGVLVGEATQFKKKPTSTKFLRNIHSRPHLENYRARFQRITKLVYRNVAASRLARLVPARGSLGALERFECDLSPVPDSPILREMRRPAS